MVNDHFLSSDLSERKYVFLFDWYLSFWCNKCHNTGHFRQKMTTNLKPRLNVIYIYIKIK